ncbi:DUF397 domain-containing protein [Kitasatospora sp. NPDC089797]|uniref:DUF397 domain-containing protein n=1 Tax=Kitasatospora sp. NPDC089797 TaxID=3155298 RepID=UPI00341C49BC
MSRTDHLTLAGVVWVKSSYSGNGGSCVEVAQWVKSSYSGNGGNCVEVARWVKSSYSDNGGSCVEVVPGLVGVMPVRDSKDPEGPVLLFPAVAWRSFVSATVAGEFGDV